MKSIGVISDTHKKFDYARKIIELFVEKKVDFIVHAGDIVDVDVLELIKNTKIKYVAVYGNNDAHLSKFHTKYNLVQEPHYFKFANKKFKLMHLPFYMTPDADIVIFGHTHVFECDFKNNTLFLNSGESCARKKELSEAVILHVDENRYDVTYYSKKPKANEFNEKQFSFECKD
ncbi:MAG: YfcE family phosphodiesterase [Campylobacterota bacterium]|nr:YfcE family phosphodiesterase [Campylobacterota bacterium]